MKNENKAKSLAHRTDSEKLDEIVRLLQFSVAIELYQSGSTQQQIAKALGIATASVNKMLQNVGKE